MKWALKNVGLMACGMCILCTAVEVHQTYAAYISHEKAREENIHKAYSNILNRVGEIQAIAAELPDNVLLPPAASKKIPDHLPQVKR